MLKILVSLIPFAKCVTPKKFATFIICSIQIMRMTMPTHGEGVRLTV